MSSDGHNNLVNLLPLLGIDQLTITLETMIHMSTSA